MARGEDSRAAFMEDLRAWVREVVSTIRDASTPVPAAAPPPPVGKCPCCAAAVVEKFKFFACASCSFKLWKRIAGKRISAPLAGVLLRSRRTRLLPGFRSKAGKRFSAALILDPTGAVRLSFGRDPPAANEPA
jgi:DNA topoisomerase-3